MKVVVDFDLCEANAVCMKVCPEVFEVDENDFLIIKDEVQHSFKSIWTCLYDDCEIKHTVLAMYLLVKQNMAFLLDVIHGWRQLHFCNVEECQNKPCQEVRGEL